LTSAADSQAAAGRHPALLFLSSIVRRRVVLIAALTLGCLAVIAIFAPIVAPFDPAGMQVTKRLSPPGGEFLFGTDEFGRDVLSRLIFGARVSLVIGITVVVIATSVGTVLGLVAGYIRRLDGPIMRLMDAMMAFPDILLAIALVAVLGSGLFNVIVALGIVYTPRVARIVRASCLVIREMQFVDAAVATGASRLRVMFSEILPNLVSPIIVQSTFLFSYAVLTEAALSYLGLGVPPTTPSWGNMIAAGQQFIYQARWLIIIPGLTIAATVVCLQIVGDGLRDALDSKLRRLL
jgi:peptide/nickel transport system permease protein